LSDIFKRNENDRFYNYFNHYVYDGSITYPPCEEYTTWYIADPIEARLTLVSIYR